MIGSNFHAGVKISVLDITPRWRLLIQAEKGQRRAVEMSDTPVPDLVRVFRPQHLKYISENIPQSSPLITFWPYLRAVRSRDVISVGGLCWNNGLI